MKEIVPVEISDNQQAQLLAYPNPFAGNINLSFVPKETGKYSLSIYDINGQLITTLYNKVAEKGISQKVEWESRGFVQGTYIASLQTPVGVQRQKIVLAR